MSYTAKKLLLPLIKPGYRPQASDTSIETDAFEFALLRQRTNGDRATMSAILTQGARQLCLCGLRQTHPSLSSTQFKQALARAFLGEDCPQDFFPRGNEMTWIQDSIALALQLQTIFERLNILYYITGGVAAATYGEPRTTRDLDVVISISLSTLDLLVQQLENESFYVPGVEDVRTGGMLSLGITHTETIARADLILTFEPEKFRRRRAISIPERGTLYFASPEDIILSKLSWGTSSQSEKQWRDVLGILKVQGQNLDFDYLKEYSEPIGVSEALTQAMTEAGL
jgi:hypothetical protein